jgi:hypothetical protein
VRRATAGSLVGVILADRCQDRFRELELLVERQIGAKRLAGDDPAERLGVRAQLEQLRATGVTGDGFHCTAAAALPVASTALRRFVTVCCACFVCLSAAFIPASPMASAWRAFASARARSASSCSARSSASARLDASAMILAIRSLSFSVPRAISICPSLNAPEGANALIQSCPMPEPASRRPRHLA